MINVAKRKRRKTPLAVLVAVIGGLALFGAMLATTASPVEAASSDSYYADCTGGSGSNVWVYLYKNSSNDYSYGVTYAYDEWSSVCNSVSVALWNDPYPGESCVSAPWNYLGNDTGTWWAQYHTYSDTGTYTCGAHYYSSPWWGSTTTSGAISD